MSAGSAKPACTLPYHLFSLQFAKMTEKGYLTFKEFLLCLAVGSVLQLFPLLKAYAGLNLITAVASARLSNPSHGGAAGGSEAAAASVGRSSTRGSVHSGRSDSSAGGDRPSTPFQTARLRAASAALAATAPLAEEEERLAAADAKAAAAITSITVAARRRSSLVAAAATAAAAGEAGGAAASVLEVRAELSSEAPADASVRTVPQSSLAHPNRPPPIGIPMIVLPTAGATSHSAAGVGSTTSVPKASGDGVAGAAAASATTLAQREESALFAHGQRLVKALR